MSHFLQSTTLRTRILETLSSNLGIEYSFYESFYTYIHSIFLDEKKIVFPYKIKIEELKTLDSSILQNNCSYGIDLPVWFIDAKSKSRKKIMILAMDPLRDKQAIPTNEISFNSPFSIHKKVNNKYYPSIQKLANNFDIYITDVFKLFYRQIENQDVLSNSLSEFNTLPIHHQLIESEIKIFNPDLILCLGKHSINGLSKIDKKMRINSSIVSPLTNYNFKNIPTFAIPHASGVASKWAKVFMEEKNDAVYNSSTYIVDAVNLILSKI